VARTLLYARHPLGAPGWGRSSGAWLPSSSFLRRFASAPFLVRAHPRRWLRYPLDPLRLSTIYRTFPNPAGMLPAGFRGPWGGAAAPARQRGAPGDAGSGFTGGSSVPSTAWLRAEGSAPSASASDHGSGPPGGGSTPNSPSNGASAWHRSQSARSAVGSR